MVVLAPQQGDSPLNPRMALGRRDRQRRPRSSERLTSDLRGAVSARRRLRFSDARSGAELDLHDFRRHAEPRRNEAGAEAARHDHVPVVLDDVAVGEARAVIATARTPAK